MCDMCTYVVENNKRLSPTTIVVADGVKDTLADNSGKDLFHEEGQKDCRNGGQDEVVNEEERLKLKPLPLAHPLTPTKDDDIVADDKDARLFQSRHGRDASLEPEVAGWIANNGFPGLIEDGP